MALKIIDLHIEVDMDSEEAKVWAKKQDFVEEEFDEVIHKLKWDHLDKPFSKLSGSEGVTDDGSYYKISVKLDRSNAKLEKFKEAKEQYL